MRNAEPAAPKLQWLRNSDELPEDARALLQACAKRYGMQCGADWFKRLEEVIYSTQSGARWLTLRGPAGVRAVWPLRSQDGAGAMSNFYTAVYSPAHAPDLAPTELIPLVREMRRSRLGRGVYDFSPMDPHSTEFTDLELALRRGGLVTFRYFRFGNWHLPCAGMTWEQFLASRKGTMRSTIRRMNKKLHGDGGRVEIVTGLSRLDVAIAAYQQVYEASWKQSEPYPEFMASLIRDCAAKGWLRLGIAWLGDQPIAAQVWTVAHGRAEIFKVAYDEAYKAYTPGTTVSAALMEHVLTYDQVREVDFLIGDDDYKKLWMTERRERWGLVAYDPLTLRGAWGALREIAARVIKRLRKRATLASRTS